MIQPPHSRQASIFTKLAYGSGHSLLSVKNMMFHFFFLFFFSNIMGVPPLWVGAATLIALFFDAFSDPVMGQISDNYRSKKWGRRHRFMLWSILPTATALYLLFAPPQGLGMAGIFMWMLVMALLVRLGLTVYGVPYYALSAELSTDYTERTSITAVREFFNNVFNMILFILAFTVFLPENPAFEDAMMNEAGYAPMAFTLAIMGGVGAYVAVYGTKHKIPDLRRYTEDTRTTWRDTFTQIKIATRLKSFVWLSGGYGLTLILYGASSALSLYMGVYLWQLSQDGKLIVSLAPFISLIPAVILATILAAKMDKKPAAILFAAVYMIMNVLPYMAYLLGHLDIANQPGLMPVIAVTNALAFSSLTAIIIITSSMLADVADEMELSTTKRQEGLLYAAYSFAQKMTFAAGTLIAALSLAAIDFPKQTKPSEVAQAKIDGLADVSIAIAVIFGAGAIYCFIRYSLTRKHHADIQKSLAEKRVG